MLASTLQRKVKLLRSAICREQIDTQSGYMAHLEPQRDRATSRSCPQCPATLLLSSKLFDFKNCCCLITLQVASMASIVHIWVPGAENRAKWHSTVKLVVVGINYAFQQARQCVLSHVVSRYLFKTIRLHSLV